MEEATRNPGRLVILAGPSCAGKSPLAAALARLHPERAAGLKPLVLYNDRAARPGECDGVDYHFRSTGEIASLEGKPGFAVMEVRGDLQAVDIESLVADLEQGDVLFEGNPFVGRFLLKHPGLEDIPRLSVFVSPLSSEELVELKNAGVDLRTLVTDVMRRKLLRRTRRQKGELSQPDLKNIEKRARSAFGELAFAHEFEHVIVNHDGEDSEHWDAFYYPLGDARRALRSFVGVLEGTAADTEQWDRTLLA